MRLAPQNNNNKLQGKQIRIIWFTLWLPPPFRHLYTRSGWENDSVVYNLNGYQVKLKSWLELRNDCPYLYSMPVDKPEPESKGTTLVPKYTGRAWKNCWYCAAHKTVKVHKLQQFLGVGILVLRVWDGFGFEEFGNCLIQILFLKRLWDIAIHPTFQAFIVCGMNHISCHG